MNRDSSERTAVQELRDRFRQEASDLILAAAEAEFAEKGLHSAGMSDIAKRARVAVGTLYNHFEDRDALLARLLESRRAELLARLDERSKDAKGSPFREQLLAMLTALFEHFDAHRPFLLIMLQEAEQRRMPRSARPDVGPLLVQIHGRFEKLVKLGLKEKTLRPAGAALLPAYLMGIVRALADREQHVDSQVPMASRASQVVEFILRGAGA